MAKKKKNRGDLDDFMNNVGTAQGAYIKMSKVESGKLIGYLHPAYSPTQRCVHKSSIPSKVEKDGEIKIRNRVFNCVTPPKSAKFKKGGTPCPLCALVKFAKQMVEEGHEDTAKVLKGGKKNTWTLGELAGDHDNFRRDLSTKDEYVFAFVQRTDDRDDEFPVQILSGPVTLARKFKAVIKSRQEEDGVEDGNPLNNPYPFKVSYDKDEDLSLIHI